MDSAGGLAFARGDGEWWAGRAEPSAKAAIGWPSYGNMQMSKGAGVISRCRYPGGFKIFLGRSRWLRDCSFPHASQWRAMGAGRGDLVAEQRRQGRTVAFLTSAAPPANQSTCSRVSAASNQKKPRNSQKQQLSHLCSRLFLPRQLQTYDFCATYWASCASTYGAHVSYHVLQQCRAGFGTPYPTRPSRSCRYFCTATLP